MLKLKKLCNFVIVSCLLVCLSGCNSRKLSNQAELTIVKASESVTSIATLTADSSSSECAVTECTVTECTQSTDVSSAESVTTECKKGRFRGILFILLYSFIYSLFILFDRLLSQYF